MSTRTLILPIGGGGLDPTDYYNKQEVDQLLSAKEDSADLATVAESGSYNDLTDKPNYGASLSMTIDSQTFVLTAQLLDQNGNNLGSAQTVDLPLESVVVSGSYDAQTKKVILTLQNGSTIEFSVADLVSGLQTEITAQNPLSADLLADGTTNKVFTATEQTKLSGIASGAEVNVQSDWNEADTTSDAYIQNKPTIPTATSQLTNDSGYVTQNEVLAYKEFPAGWHTTGTIADLIADIAADTNATEGMSFLGTVSFSDLPANLVQGEIIVDIMADDETLGKNVLFTLTSSNQSPYHWEYTSAYGSTGTWRSFVPTGTLAAVATSGSYNDLTNKPTIPAAQVNSDWNASSGVAEILNKPTIPTVNDATVTIRQTGQADQTFTLNQSSNATIDIAAGGGGSDWFGTQAQFDALQNKDTDTNYFISGKLDYNNDLKNTPDLSSYATKTEVQTADATLNSKIGAKMEAQFMTEQEFSQITPKEGENYFIQGETVAMTFTLTGGSTVTYNVVVD